MGTIFEKFMINPDAMDPTFYICFGVVAFVMILLIIKKLMSIGKRALFGVLSIIFLIFAVPRINTILINKIGHYGIIERKLAEIVDGDIENKVKYDYKMKTGQDINDEGLLEKLKAETFKVDPNLNDDLNILMNCGLPSGITNTILLNVVDTGTAVIEAPTFAEYVAKFFVIRITWLISLIIGFSLSTRLFT